MYTALILVGIITLSTCRPEMQSQVQQQQQTTDKPNPLRECPDLPPKQQFNPTAYFRDVWYVVRTFYPNVTFDNNECSKFTSEILEDGTVRQLFTQFYGESEIHIRSKTHLDEFKNGLGKFVSQSIDKEGKILAPLQPLGTTVIDTDYTNYALEHICLPVRVGVRDSYLILNRKPNTVDPNVEPILTKLKLKLQDFALMNNPGCEKA